jgi:ribosomal protein L2
MNPVDHPHGGGEGKKSGINKTPWGKYNRKTSKKILINEN